MRRPLLATAAAFAVLAIGSQRAAAAGLQASCDIGFSGSSGLGPWTGKVPTIRVHPASAQTPGRWNAAFEIPVASLEDGNKVRDTQMHEMFQSRTWPAIRVQLRDVDPAEAEKTLRLPLELTIRDQTKHLEAALGNWRRTGDRMDFEADVVISLEAFALEAPMMLGLSRVNDEIRIHARVTVSPATGG